MNPAENKTTAAQNTSVPPTSQNQTPQATQESQPSSLKQIRTYQGDIAQAIQGQNESIYSIRQAEKAREAAVENKNPEQEQSSPNRLKAIALLVGSFILVGAGVVGGWYSYVQFIKKTALPNIEVPANRLVIASKVVDFDSSELSRSSLIKAVMEESSKADLAEGEILHINISEKIVDEETGETSVEPASSQKLMEILGSRAPGNLVRAFNPIFMLGAIEKPAKKVEAADIFSTSTPSVASSTSEVSSTTASSTGTTTPVVLPEVADESIFLIIKLDSFENAFAGMLEWEKNIAEDIGPLFATREILAQIPAGTAFSDITERNKDSRVIKTEDGQTALLYSFFNDDTLIITDNLETLHVIIDRLTNKLLSR